MLDFYLKLIPQHLISSPDFDVSIQQSAISYLLLAHYHTRGELSSQGKLKAMN